MATGFVKVTKNVLDSIRKALPENERKLILGLATSVEEEYRSTAPRDTGSMAETVHVKMKDGVYQHGQKTSEGSIATQARSLNAKASIVFLPTPAEKTTALVAPIVGHFAPNEYGSRYRAARPTLQNARNKVRNELTTKHRDLLYRVVTNGHKK